MKLFILIALLWPVASVITTSKSYEYGTTHNCGGYNSTIDIETCKDGDFCLLKIRKAIKGEFRFRGVEEIKEPLFFRIFEERFRRQNIVYKKRAVIGPKYLFNIITFPVKVNEEYTIPLEISHRYIPQPKDIARLTVVIDNIRDEVMYCASRDIIYID